MGPGGRPLFWYVLYGEAKWRSPPVEFAVVLSRERERVRNGGIALQRLADAQPVFKHSGNMRTFFGARRFPLHQRSQCHDVLHAAVRCGARRRAK